MIHFQGVTKNFRKARVLDGIDLDIGLGERVALIGSNGAGKTTLIRCLLGEYAHGGSVTIEAAHLRRSPPGTLVTLRLPIQAGGVLRKPA